jgi:hypothetical protein
MSAQVVFLKLGRTFAAKSLSAGLTYYDHRDIQLLRDFRSGDQPDDPMLVDHDDSRVVGTVNALFEHRDLDGTWICARTTITDPPAWLRRGTPASWGNKIFDRQSHGGIERVLGGLVTEVSILSPGKQPADPAAQVISIRRGDLDRDEMLQAWKRERTRYRCLVEDGMHKGITPPLPWPTFAGITVPPPSSEPARPRERTREPAPTTAKQVALNTPRPLKRNAGGAILRVY